VIKSLRPYLWGLLALAIVTVINIAFGAVTIPPISLGRMLAAQIPGLSILPDWPETYATILFRIRLPHAILIILTGAALASSGAVYQGLFRNPLADPYLIGVASGAGLGAVLAMSLRWPQTLLGMFAVPAAAFLGAIITVAVVYNLARVGRTAPTSALILAGVAVSAFAASLTSLLMLRSNEELRRAISWLLGGGTMNGWLPVFALLPYLTIGIGMILLSGYTLNVLQFGDEQAQQLGLAVERRKLLLVIAASLTTGAAVAFTGVIGFIGLIVPHVVRFIWGVDYRRILPLSLVGGAIALLLADVLARVLVSPEVLPLGIMTALAGGPFFLWIMRRSRGQALS
jgi:iron complex transport system permease protein